MTSEAGASAEETAVPAEPAATAFDTPAPAAIATTGAAPLASRVPEAFPDDNAIDERSLVALYAGENAEAYLRTYDRMVASRYGVLTWSWPALLIPLAWLSYRRLWVPVAWFVFLPFVLFYLTEVPSGLVAMQVAFATQAKQVYVWQAQKRIARILAVETDPQTIRRTAARAGGISGPGLVIGMLVTLGAWFAVLASVVPNDAP